MPDIYIFGFGLVVTVLIGSALSAMIVAKNRALDEQEEEGRGARAVPVRQDG